MPMPMSETTFALEMPVLKPTRVYTKRQTREEKLAKRLAKNRAEFFETQIANTRNGLLFDDLFDLLIPPIIKAGNLPSSYESDIRGVPVVEYDDIEIAQNIDIPYEIWGDTWLTSKNGLSWSCEAVLHLQNRLLWRSLEELSLDDNAIDKWSALRWIFRPAIGKYFMFDKEKAKSACFFWIHERDEPFSFHNCCMAAGMDADVVREGVRRNLFGDVIKAIDNFAYD